MLELSGSVELIVTEVETQQEERLVLTAKDFHLEKRLMLDDDVLREDDDDDYVAYVSALGYDFKAVATPPNNLEFEDGPEEVRVDIVENNIEFVEPLDDESEIED